MIRHDTIISYSACHLPQIRFMFKILSGLPKRLFALLFASKRRTVVVLIILALLFSGYRYIAPKGATGAKYVVAPTVFTEVVTASGHIAAGNSVDLKFTAPSKVTWVGVAKGDTVNAWQGVAAVDSRTLAKNLKEKLLDYMTTRWNWEQSLSDNNVTTGNIYDRPFTDAEKRILEKAQFGLDKSVLDVEIADLAVKESVLVSPISGTVVDNGNLHVWENLTGSDLVTHAVRVVDLSSLYFEAKVDEVDYAKIAPGQRVTVTLDAYPGKKFPGLVRYIGQQGVKTTSGSITILVDVNIETNNEKLVTDLNGDASFIVSEKPAALVIPRDYVFFKNGKANVKLLVKGKSVDREISLGAASGNQAEVVKGLSAGDTIVPSK